MQTGLNYQLNFRHFSGYVEIPGTTSNSTKRIHYYFIESERDPAADPVVWWSNGGPGCSGLLGLFTEQGPYKPNGEGVLEENPSRWNQLANMLFVEQPVGVGFSYSTDPEADYDLVSKGFSIQECVRQITNRQPLLIHIYPTTRQGDRQAMKDNYLFILGFFAKFPQYLPNDFVISSESWGGHYIPMLAVEILKEQSHPDASPRLNFVGFLVGNPYTSWVNNRQATYRTFWGHQLVSFPSFTKWEKACGDIEVAPQYLQTECMELEAQMDTELAGLNPYALSYPVCIAEKDGHVSKAGRAQRTWLLHHTTPPEVKARKQQLGVGIIDIADYEPCEDNYLVSYLNQAAVKTALHVEPSITWEECSTTIKYDLRDFFLPMEPLYQWLLDGHYGLKMLVYSGDDDSVCGTWGTQKWMWGLKRKALTNWLPWRDSDGQLAGYVTQFRGNLTLATVHGAGHGKLHVVGLGLVGLGGRLSFSFGVFVWPSLLIAPIHPPRTEVPTYTPKTALELFGYYLDGTWFNPQAFVPSEDGNGAQAATSRV